METRIADFLVRQRVAMFFLALALIGGLSVGAKFLWFESSYRIFFAADNPYLIAHDAIEAEYTKADNVAFIVAPDDGEVFTAKTLTAIRELTARAWEMPRSIRVDSITNFQHSEVRGDDLETRALVENHSVLDAAGLARIKAAAMGEPALVTQLISARAHVTSVNVRLEMPGDSREATPANKEVMTFARALAAEFEEKYPHLTIHLMGQVVVNQAFNETSERDAGTLVPLMFVVVIVLIGLFLRSIPGTLVTALMILVSIASTIGFLGWIGFQVNQVNVSAPIIILTLAVSDCVHVLVHFFEDLRRGVSREVAMRHTLEVNLTPVFLTSVTTAIGFLSLNTSDSPPFRELGSVVGFGVIGAMLWTLMMLPALMLWLPVRPGKESSLDRFNLSGLADALLRRHRRYFYGALGVAAALFACIPLNTLDDDTVAYFGEALPIRQAFDFVQENLTGVDTITYSLPADGENGIYDPAYLNKVEAFANWWRAQPEVTHVSTFTDVVKRLNRNLHADDPAYYVIPDDRALAAQYVLLYELSLPQGLDLNDQVNVDKSATRLSVNIANAASRETIAIEQRGQQWLAAHAPEFKTQGTSLSVMFAHISMNNIYSMLKSSLIAIALISITLIIALRSWKFGLLSLLPNAFPAGMAFGVWGFYNGYVNLAIAAVFSITLGIVVDNTIHFFSKYLYARRVRGSTPDDAIRYGFSTVGAALLVTTVALTLGFLILAQSDFNVNASMGQMTALVILIALTFDLFFLPGLLMRFDRAPLKTPTP